MKPRTPRTTGYSRGRPSAVWWYLFALLTIWVLIIVVVNPLGEFMVNDDWAFVKSLESLRNEGQLASTGWGPRGAPGGPSLITHLLWGLLFVEVWGFSLTILRISVLTLGVLGSVSLLFLLRFAGASDRTAFLGTLTLVFNPLFLSQCFTFMSDVTFTSYALFAIPFLALGVDKGSTGWIILGLCFALASILTRQIGIVIPLAFAATIILHPRWAAQGRTKWVLLSLGITIVPWLAYEFFLAEVGSTPLTEHQVIHNIIRSPFSKGFPDYPLFLLQQLLHGALGYTCLLVSPVLVLRYRELWATVTFKRFVVITSVLFAVLEALILTGIVNPPVFFYRNVIYDFGIGPVLLKDTYTLGIPRGPTIPKPLFYVLVYWAILAIGAAFVLGVRTLRKLGRGISHGDEESVGFLPAFTLLAALAYVGIILLTDFHDRYLIPVCALFIIWIVSDMPREEDPARSRGMVTAAVVPLIVFAVFSVAGTRDFMALKRAEAQAHKFLLTEIHAEPCNVDGGFEFNGYHCVRNDFEPRAGLSWWWVHREDYVVTLGTLPGYRVIRRFPFTKYLGADGAVYVLQPLGNKAVEDGRSGRKKQDSAGR
jgi:hypothetical protein